MPAQKNPLIALTLSIVAPGLGQLYNKEATKGLAIAGSCLVLGLGSMWVSGLARISIGLTLLVVWVSAILDAYKTAKVFGQPLDWYYRVPYVVTMLLLVGPMALPLLWRSPYFSRFARWCWTSVVIGALLLFLSTPYILSWLIRQDPELKAFLYQSNIYR